MLILMTFDREKADIVRKLLKSIETYRDGPGFRHPSRPSYYFPLNNIEECIDGAKLVFEVGIGGKEAFYENVVNNIKSGGIPLTVDEFTTDIEK